MRLPALVLFGVGLAEATSENGLSLTLPTRDDGLSLTLLDAAEAMQSGSVCLDGSPPGLYHRPATTAAANTSWVIFMKGGAWCTSLEDCANRAQSNLGSSTKFPTKVSVGGPIDPDPEKNPTFADFHHVYIPYCDGASFAGNRLAAVNYTNTQGNTTSLFFRGKRVLDFVLDYLRENTGLGAATHVLFGGGSAGGLATYLNADRVGMWLRENLDSNGSKLIQYRALPVSGWFPDHNSYVKTEKWWTFVKNSSSSTGYNDVMQGFLAAGDDVPSLPKRNESVVECQSACVATAACLGFTFPDPTSDPDHAVSCSFKSKIHFVSSTGVSYGEQMHATYDLHNATVPAACRASLPVSERWRCFLANYSYAFSETPMFPLQSAVDLYSLFAIARLGNWQQGCLSTRYQFENCSSQQIQHLIGFESDFVSDLKRSEKFSRAGEGGFVESCLEHQGGVSTIDFNDYIIDGVSMQQALSAWWSADGTDPSSQHWHLPCPISSSSPHQCNPTCFTGPKHRSL